MGAWMNYFKVESSLTADASDINDNFYYFNQGSVLPRNETDDSFASIDVTNNIGSSIATWNNFYCKDAAVSSSISANNNLWVLLDETTLLVTTSSIEFSGLNGDSVEEYMIISKFVESVFTAGGNVSKALWFNSDTGASSNYTREYMYAAGVNIYSILSTSTAIVLCYGVSAAAGEYVSSAFCKSYINAKTGHNRSIVGVSSGKVNEKSVGGIARHGGVWDNTSDTISSITIAGTTAITMEPNTNIQLWGRK